MASSAWKQEGSGARWSRDAADSHLTVRECAGTFDAFGPHWLALTELHLPDGTAVTWRSAPFPPTKEGLMASMAWAEEASARLEKKFSAQEGDPAAPAEPTGEA